MAGTAIVVLFLIERAVLRIDPFNPQDARVFAGACALFFAVGCGFLFGAKAFGQLKDNHTAFLFSLPAGRTRSWLTIVAANLATGAGCSGIIALVYPPRAFGFDPGIIGRQAVTFVLMFFGLYFLGACTVLIFKRAAVVAVAGVLMLSGGIASIVAVHAYLNTNGPFRFFSWILPCFLLCLFAAVSLGAFARGEFINSRVRFLNLVKLLASFVVFAAVFGTVINQGVPALFGAWREDLATATVSDDGRHIAVLRSHRNYPVYGLVEIIDAKTGRLLRTFRGNHLRNPVWSADGLVLNVVSTPFWPRESLVRLPAADPILESKSQWFTITYAAVRIGREIRLLATGWNGRDDVALKTPDTAGNLDVIAVRSAKADPPPAPGQGPDLSGVFLRSDWYEGAEDPLLFMQIDRIRKLASILIYRNTQGWKPAIRDVPVTDQEIKIFQQRGALPRFAIDHLRHLIAYRGVEVGTQVGYVYEWNTGSLTTLGRIGDAASETPNTTIGRYGSDVPVISFSDGAGFLYHADNHTFLRISLLPGHTLLWADDEGNKIYRNGAKEILYFKADGGIRRLWPVAP